MKKINFIFCFLLFSACALAQQVGIYPQVTASGTDTYTASYSGITPAPTSFVTGARYQVKFTNANSSTTPTLSFGFGVKTLFTSSGGALTAGSIAANDIKILTYDGAGLRILTSGGGGAVADASPSTKGIAKLYNSTGGNVDGAMDQSSVTTAINAKVVDAINDGATAEAPSQNAVYDALQTKRSFYNVKAYGALGDRRTFVDGAITTGTAILTSASGAAFTSADVGKLVFVQGAGAAGAPLNTTVLSYQSATQVTLSASASTTVSGAICSVGTDDLAAFNAAVSAAPVGSTVYIPTGQYILSAEVTINKRINLMGDGPVSSVISTGSLTARVFNYAQVSVATMLSGFSIRDLQVSNLNSTSSPSGTSNGIRLKYCYDVDIDNVVLFGFNNNLLLEDVYRLHLSKMVFWAYVTTAINYQNLDAALLDFGDSDFTQLTFIPNYRNATYSIFQNNAGGLKISDSKFNRGSHTASFHYHYNGSNNNTSDLLIDNCSFENFGTNAIRIAYNSGANFANVVISGCQFALGGSVSDYYVLLNNVDGGAITGNTFNGISTSNPAINLNNCSYIYLQNSYRNHSDNPIIQSGTTVYTTGWVNGVFYSPAQPTLTTQSQTFQSKVSTAGQMSESLNFSGTFSGTINTTSGRQWNISDNTLSKVRMAIDAGGDFWLGESTSVYGMRVTQAGQFYLAKTVTAGGTTGAQTINKTAGSVNFAAGAQTIVVTNSFVSTSSLIFPAVLTDDTTAKSAVISSIGSGTFTIKLNATATAETKVSFFVVN